MMDREQRIEYEILDCALRRASHAEGHLTMGTVFTERLRQLFPDIQPQEFTAACKRLADLNVLFLYKRDSRGGTRDYQAGAAAVAFFDGEFWLSPSAMSQTYFKRLSSWIDPPPGFVADPRHRR